MQSVLPGIWGNKEDDCFYMRQVEMENFITIKLDTEISQVIFIKIQFLLINKYILGKESM
jgi:hypothetical protein